MRPTRELILERVRANQPAPQPLPAVPAFPREGLPPVEAFVHALSRMGGTLALPSSDQSLDDFIRARHPDATVICSATPEVAGTLQVEQITGPEQLERVDVGVVRAVFGVAETGSVWLSERELGHNALAYLAQHLIVLLDPRAIVPDLHAAYAQRGFFEARYAVLLTGPSATADIEGVLVRGAQGVRSLTVVPVPV
jgi:L-lactate dehydrogenase complex protein LldG